MISIIKSIIYAMTPGQRKKFLILQILVILMAFAEVLGIASIAPFMALVGDIDLVYTNRSLAKIYAVTGLASPTDFLFFSGLIFLALLFISAAISVFTIWKLSFFAAETGAEIADSLYSYYIKKDYLYHIATSSTFLTKQIATEVSRVTDNILQPFVQINARIVVSVFISIAVILYNPIISLVGITSFIFSYWVLFIIVKNKLYKNGVIISNVSQERFNLINEGFGAIKEVQLRSCTEIFIKKFVRSGKKFSAAYGSSNGLYNMPRYFMELIIYSGMVILVLILLKTSNGQFSKILPTLSIFGLAAFKLLPSFQQIYAGLAQIRSNLSALESIKNDVVNAYIKRNELKIPKKTDIALNNMICLNNISFKYPSKNSNALSNINISFPINGIVGLVGSSGSGKSTLIDILLCLIDPDSGSLTIGGAAITKDNKRIWQNNIGYVPQGIFLIDGTILQNIAFGIEEELIDIDKINQVLKQSHLDEWVHQLAAGLHTRVGERGVQLSGGQKQRLGIARALYSNPEILIFDEATSALDGVTEQLIMDAIVDLGVRKTIIMVAHRLNTVKDCDVIFVMDGGRVVDSGTYCYLIEHNKIFRNMANQHE